MSTVPELYVPALKWRQAEYQALLRLQDKAKTCIKPFIMIPPIEFDFEDNTPKKTPHDHIEPFARRYRDKWNTRPAWIDVDSSLHATSTKSGKDIITHVFDELRTFGAQATPVTSLDNKAKVVAAIRKVLAKDKKGVAIRARLEHVMRPSFSEQSSEFLDALGSSSEEADLIVDLGTPAYEPYAVFASALQIALGKILDLNDYRSFMMIGTAFPDSMKDVESPGASVSRHDWHFYKHLINSLPKGMRAPGFGDYTIVHPAFVAALDMRMIKPAGKLVYTTKNDWKIRKGGAFRDNPNQMYDHCKYIVNSEFYCGADYSDGDQYIYRCSQKEVGHSTMTRWKEIGINHHMMHAIDDLARFAETS
jgi:hypothetical protein